MRILVTGLSGTGKSTVIDILAHRGYDVIDTDDGDWCVPDGGHDSEWLWDEARMSALLADDMRTPIFISGCRENQGNFYDRFDEVVLLTAPLDVMLQRISSRTTNPFGKSQSGQLLIRDQKEKIEPVLRLTATSEVDTAIRTADEVAEQLVGMVRRSG